MSGPNSIKLGNNHRAIIGDSIIRLHFRRVAASQNQDESNATWWKIETKFLSFRFCSI